MLKGVLKHYVFQSRVNQGLTLRQHSHCLTAHNGTASLSLSLCLSLSPLSCSVGRRKRARPVWLGLVLVLLRTRCRRVTSSQDVRRDSDFPLYQSHTFFSSVSCSQLRACVSLRVCACLCVCVFDERGNRRKRKK